VDGRKDAVSWLKRFFRRLKIRYERRDDVRQAFSRPRVSADLLALRPTVLLGSFRGSYR
jgi:hypothetical protein